MAKKVYLFRAAQFYKIGISGNYTKRISQIQTGCPIKCEYIGYFPTADPDLLEKALHERFNGFKTYGEWFDLGDDNIRLLITEFNLKYITNPFTSVTQEQEVITNAPALKKAREAAADIEEITLLYEELYPGNTLSDYGKTGMRKYVLKYGKVAVVESIYKLSERFDTNQIHDILPYAIRNYATYGRHINDETWKAYYKIKNISPESASEFLKFVMVNKIDSNKELINCLAETIIEDHGKYNLGSTLKVFLKEINEYPS